MRYSNNAHSLSGARTRLPRHAATTLKAGALRGGSGVAELTVVPNQCSELLINESSTMVPVPLAVKYCATGMHQCDQRSETEKTGKPNQKKNEMEYLEN